MNIISAAKTDIVQQASGLLNEGISNTILTNELSSEDLDTIFRETDCIFTDADGTFVEEGLTAVSPDYIRSIQELSEVGVTVTVVTGKPYEEVFELVHNLPQGFPLKVIYEKGAYCLEPDETGTMQKGYLLSSPELEANVHDLRTILMEHIPSIENKYKNPDGTKKVTIGWSGAGNHKSVLSIDILAGIPPANYLELRGPIRETFKVTDPDLLAQVEADLKLFLEKHRSDWRLIHIGNANSEIAPGPIEKDFAITQTDTFKNAKGILVWGDSGNDRKMFELRKLPKVHAGLVLHREKSVDLAQEVDFVSFGMANVQPFFELLRRAKRSDHDH